MDDVELRGPDGEVVADVELDVEFEPLPRALITARPDASADEVGEAIVTRFPLHRVSVREERLADALVVRGAELVRASSLMLLSLPAEVSAPEVDVRPIRDAADEYGAIAYRAYPPDHPDHDLAETSPEAAAATIAAYLAGAIVGPLLRDASSEAWTAEGELAGMCIIGLMPPDGEIDECPWITDVCVLPSAQGQGLGRAMVAHAIAQLGREGHAALGLAVTQGIPARRLYESLGFVERFPAWTLHTG